MLILTKFPAKCAVALSTKQANKFSSSLLTTSRNYILTESISTKVIPDLFYHSVDEIVANKSSSKSHISMQAVRVHEFGAEDKLKFEDDVIVPTLEDTKILIRVHTAGVNPVDTYIRQGTYSRLPKLPFIPGMDGAGVVEEVGDNITKFKVGDRVFFSRNVQGSYAQFVLADEQGCWPLPSHLTFEQGASIGVPYFTAYRALFQKSGAKAGLTVLVHGASGAVGLAACQLAKLHGLTVFGTARTEEGINLVKTKGLADQAFNHKEKHYLDKILSQTKDNAGVDIILEMLANVNLGYDLSLLKQNGVVIIVGSRGQVQIDPRHLMTKESKVVGVSLLKSTDREWEENISAVLNGLNNKQLEPVVATVYSLKDASKAHHDVIHNKGSRGKLVLKIQ